MRRTAEDRMEEEPQQGRWELDGAGLLVYTERFGWFAYPFGPHPALGPFADLETARASLRARAASQP